MTRLRLKLFGRLVCDRCGVGDAYYRRAGALCVYCLPGRVVRRRSTGA